MDPAQVLGNLPTSLRKELLDTFNNIVRNYKEHRWEPSELNGGKLCEVVYTILKGHLDGTFPAKSSKPKNMLDACQQLENYSSRFPRSIRIQVPRMLIALYEVRNNRGVGHVGGEVDPNNMDATIVLYHAKWIVAELVRIFHNVDTKTASEAVTTLIQKEIPLIWDVNGRKKVLSNKLTIKQKVLLLLYSQTGTASEGELALWTEQKNAAAFRRDILKPLHKKLLIDYDTASKNVTISPLGNEEVELKLL